MAAAQAESLNVTRRAWKILALGAVAIAASGGFAAAEGRSSAADKPLAHWGLYSSAEWDVVTAGFARRGFARDSVRIVTGTKLANGRSFALIGGRSKTGRSCFAVVRGATVGATICTISKPLVVFPARDTCCAPPRKMLTILGLVRRDVSRVTMVTDGREGGLGIVPTGNGFAFNVSVARSDTRLRARGADSSVIADVSIHRP